MEIMDLHVAGKLLSFMERVSPASIDITGGSPELMPGLIPLLAGAKRSADKVSMRTNLTLLGQKRFSRLLRYLKKENIELVASLPCYTSHTVDGQRGDGVFERSIDCLRSLNQLGFGEKKGRRLNLVYNPSGPRLPPQQSGLEDSYRSSLAEIGISFDNLYAMANAPLGRFKKDLISTNKYHSYISLLEKNFNPCSTPHLMCLNQITVDWRGRVYDCDFNLAAGLPENGLSSVFDTDASDYIGRHVHTAGHCLSCTAGNGSSCHGGII